jgi:hypothetical protein
MQDAKQRLGQDKTVVLRPWLQDFSLGSPAYGIDEVRAQINACQDQGIDEWLLWDPTNGYTDGALKKE